MQAGMVLSTIGVGVTVEFYLSLIAFDYLLFYNII